ncbi:MAG: aminotransferase class I/II-fold pyridoxal phosphate-dependent enzyme [Pseudomonadota bacterium]
MTVVLSSCMPDSQGQDHGGTDAGPPVCIDFSTNAHPLGPNPWVWAAVRQSDLEAYPDPTYTALRGTLAALHAVAPERIVVGASASELIWRLSGAFAQAAGQGPQVCVAAPTFGEYARAAVFWGLPVVAPHSLIDGAPTLRWLCRPNNPTGASMPTEEVAALARAGQQDGAWPLVVDLAYQPFASLLAPHLDHHPGTLNTPWADQVVQLWSPNKLHGLTGVRGAYLVLPVDLPAAWQSDALARRAPSWVQGADGVALLSAHAQAPALHSLQQRHADLQACKAAQDIALQSAGWHLTPSPLHFGLAMPPEALRPPVPAERWHTHLRAHGIKLRRGDSFGLPGWVRLCVRPPADVAKLIQLTHPMAHAATPS